MGGGGPASVTVNAAALAFQCRSVPQPGLNTPTRTVWGPKVSVGGTVQSTA